MLNHNFLNVKCIFCFNAKSTFNSVLFDLNNLKYRVTSGQHLFNHETVSQFSNNILSIYYQNSNLHTNFVLSTHDVYILTETWLSKELSDAELGLDGYVTFRCDRNINTSSSLRGGDTLIAVLYIKADWHKEEDKIVPTYELTQFIILAQKILAPNLLKKKIKTELISLLNVNETCILHIKFKF
ncbi:Uncharacterized protein FWK35_00025851 [Aphis craccivora]|uniref:Uncharacterized protein n=1 Tax=Aphis craccivora TaxID=307492 RepID=A0A6G0XH92_APHCR|nr:Uncharacterized protein FWK35_00025851 [Aphis craccivora]